MHFICKSFHWDGAGKYSQDLLIKQIINEQKELSKTSSKWEKLKKCNANLTIRLDLAGLDNQIRRMLKKRHNS